jgi:hypothetical protein
MMRASFFIIVAMIAVGFIAVMDKDEPRDEVAVTNGPAPGIAPIMAQTQTKQSVWNLPQVSFLDLLFYLIPLNSHLYDRFIVNLRGVPERNELAQNHPQQKYSWEISFHSVELHHISQQIIMTVSHSKHDLVNSHSDVNREELDIDQRLNLMNRFCGSLACSNFYFSTHIQHHSTSYIWHPRI